MLKHKTFVCSFLAEMDKIIPKTQFLTLLNSFIMSFVEV